MQSQNNQILPQTNTHDNTVKKIQHYLFSWSDLIGKGSFSQVYLGINQHNQQPVAIKLIKNQSIKSKTAQRLLNHEISILKYLDHQNVIKCYDVLTSLNHCYIVTDYCSGGDLDKILKKKKLFNQQQISKIIYDVYKGLQYLNQNAIVHRDLKLANIFLSNDTYKIADFGFSIRSKSLFTDIPVGSPIYMSPQGLIYNNYGPKTDVWSFGVMIYQLLHGEAPLENCRSEQQLKTNILKEPQIKAKISPQLQQLILKCLQPNVQKRITISQIKQTSYIKNIASIYQTITISQKLTSTYHSTSASSTVQNIFNRFFDQEQALSILHYCRLLHKTSLKTGSKDFALWLLLIFQGLVRCKVTPLNPARKIKKENESKPNCQNLKQVILQYHQKYKKQHILITTVGVQLPNFESILSQCTQLYKQYESKSLNELKNIVFNLYKETQMLNQSFKANKLKDFAKYSQAKKFLSELSKNFRS